MASGPSAAVRLESDAAYPTASVQTPDGRWLRLNSTRDPIGEADRFIAPAFDAGEPDTLFVVGLGLGYVLDAVERRSSRTKVLALEPLSATLPFMFQRRDWADWTRQGRLTLLSGPEYQGAPDASMLLDGRIASPPIVTHPVLLREFPRETARARQLAGTIVAGAQANENARRKFAGPYLLNTIQNIPVICSEADVSTLFGAFPEIPGVVIAAGPSLDRNLEELREIQDRALLIAVDTALRPLLAAGIRPHLVVAVDLQEANARNLIDASGTEGICLVGEGSLDPSAFRHFGGRTFCFRVSNHHPWPWLEQHGCGRDHLKAWGSVLTTAFDLACRLACDPIVFAGADLAYTDGLVYGRNTIYDRQLQTSAARAATLNEKISIGGGAARAPDVRGGTTLTTPAFVQFRNWLVSQSLEVTTRRIVNATGAGILHGGRIEQTGLGALSLGRIANGTADLRARLASAWATSASPLGKARRRVARALTSKDGRSIPVTEWQEAARNTASAEQIAASLDAAQVLLALLEDSEQDTHPSPVLFELWMKRGLLERAEAVARALYAEPACTLVDALSRVGWAHKVRGNLPNALELLRADHDAGRQSPRWRLNFATALIHGAQREAARTLLEGMTVETLPPDTHESFVLHLAYVGHFDEAESQVRRLYARPPITLHDGFSRIAGELCKAGRAARALDLLREDYRAGRQTPGWTVYFLMRLLEANQAEEAESIFPSIAPTALPTAWHQYQYALSAARLGRIPAAL